jgi:HPt (histidine-containing phosphotransfer) domain-containing protein
MTPSLPSARPSSDGDGNAPSAARRVLDVEDGLDRIMGDRGLYLKLLRRFKHDHQGALKQLQDAVAADRYAAAQLKAHTIKGGAGMIGARALHALAAQMEAALRARAPSADLPWQEFTPGLNRVLNTINSILPVTHATPLADGETEGNPAPADAATLGLLKRLAHYLREGDGAAIDLLEDSAPPLARCLGVPLYQQVAAAAHEFDFDGALAALMQRQWETDASV